MKSAVLKWSVEERVGVTLSALSNSGRVIAFAKSGLVWKSWGGRLISPLHDDIPNRLLHTANMTTISYDSLQSNGVQILSASSREVLKSGY